MIRNIHVVCVTVFMGTMGAMGCAIDEGDEAELEAIERAATLDDDAATSAAADATAGGPAFIDACLLPGSVKATFQPTGGFDAGDEGVTAVLNLPFTFKLYGKSHTKFWITPNGQLGFGTTRGGSAFGQVRCPLADTRFKTPIVLVYSADLVTRMAPDAGVCFATRGTAPRRKLVVTWKDSFFYDAWLNSHVTFSATLHETSNYIDVAIDRVDAPTLPTLEDGNSVAIGRQTGGSAQAHSCHQPYAPEGTLVRFQP